MDNKKLLREGDATFRTAVICLIVAAVVVFIVWNVRVVMRIKSKGKESGKDQEQGNDGNAKLGLVNVGVMAIRPRVTRQWMVNQHWSGKIKMERPFREGILCL
jgi:hypothetical protein